MKIIENISVPTGNILIVEGDYGKLECLSIGDYGKEINLKADFMGLSRKPDKVRHTELTPLTDKWVITISTQYGCSMGCSFCDVPKVGKGRNASLCDLLEQVVCGLELHSEITYSNRLNIHFARMGEPTFNKDVLEATKVFKQCFLPKFNVHPVVSTMMPCRNSHLQSFINQWMDLKNVLYEGNAGLQLSINSTDEQERSQMFNGSAHTLEEISQIMECCVGGWYSSPVGRKITLNFAVANYTIDPHKLAKLFSPEYYVVKLTPMHKTTACGNNCIQTSGDYTTYVPYETYEQSLKSVGFDVIVFIASKEEDEGRITCGNAILSGTRPFDCGAKNENY